MRSDGGLLGVGEGASGGEPPKFHTFGFPRVALPLVSTLKQMGDFGNVIAVSGDGSVVAVCSTIPPTLYIYATSPQGTWEVVDQKLGPCMSLALSYDGRTVAVGDPVLGRVTTYVTDDDDAATSYHKHADILAPLLSAVAGEFGASVAVAADGMRALIGAPGTVGPGGPGVGAAYIFNAKDDASGARTWTEAAALSPPGFVAFPTMSRFGGQVAFSADGHTAVATSGVPQLVLGLLGMPPLKDLPDLGVSIKWLEDLVKPGGVGIAEF